MGMVMYLRRASDERINALLADPASVERFLYDPAIENLPGAGELMAALKEKFGFTAPLPLEDAPREDGDEINLDKIWHVLHFVLTGSARATSEPLSFLIGQWPEIGDVDTGYGPAKAIRSDAVSRFRNALTLIGSEHIKTYYKPEEMQRAGVYLAASLGDDADEIADIEHSLQKLRNFLDECVVRNAGVITYIS